MQIGRGLCLAGAALGALGLVGWISGAASLTTLVPGKPPMMPNTSLALASIGAAGALWGRAGVAGRILGLLATGFVLAMGAGTLAEYTLGIDLHIDRLLFATDVGPYPGRPSPLTAVALTVSAAALLLIDSRPTARARPSEWLALSSGLIGFTALLGQLFGASELYRFREGSVIGVAFPTALGLLSTAAGLLLLRPDAGMMRLVTSPGPGGIVLRRHGLAVVMLPAALGFLVQRLLAVFGVESFPLLLGTLGTTVTVMGLVLLVLSAASLERSHEALESSRMRTQTLFEQASEGIFVADSSGRYTEVNSAGCRMLGYTREEILGKTIRDLVPPEDLERLGRHRERLLAGSPEVSEWTLRSKDGSYVAVEVSARILPDGRWQGFVRDIRERNRVRDQLRQSQERLDLALRGADLAAWDWNTETGEVVFNARWAEMRGFRPDEIQPHVDSWLAGVHPDDLPHVRGALDEHFAGRAPEYVSEHRVATRSGEWLWILDRGKVFMRDERGRPLRMVGTELDITNRKRLEEELRRSEAQSSGILSISADAIISVDENQNIVLYNEGAEQIFGYAREEALGAPLEILIPERFRSAHRLHVERFAAGTAAARRMGERDAVIRGRRKSGEEFFADAAISKLEVGDECILTVALRDVTDQKRIEGEQKLLAEVGAVLTSSLEYEETLRDVARLLARDLADLCTVDVVEETGEIGRMSVASLDPSLNGIRDALMRMAPDRKGPSLIASVLETRRPVAVPEITPAMIASSTEDEELIRLLWASGPPSAMAVPLVAHGKVLGAITLLSCAPSRRYTTGEARLAEKVAERAALSIESARLYRASRRATQARDDVLAIVAHDLRNPLSTILVAASSIRRRAGDTARQIRYAEAIESSVMRMNRLIQDLLDVTCFEAGHLSVEPVRLPTAQVLLDSVEAHRSLAASARLELRIDAAPDLPHVWADRDRLLQVFENLISNAIKATTWGGAITVGATPRSGEVVFRVEDTGRGIAPEHVPRLFDRFWKSNEKRAGAGLGLAIVKGIVEAHGGRVWVDSTPGHGSSFFFTIPSSPPESRA